MELIIRLFAALTGLFILLFPHATFSQTVAGNGNIYTDSLYATIAANPASFYVVMKPDTTLKRTMTLSNEGTDTLFYSINTFTEKAATETRELKSIAGSTLTANANTYKPGENIDFTFNLYNGSPDNEWLQKLIIHFPQDVSLNFSTNFVGGSLGPLVFNGATGNGVTAIWNDLNGGGGNILPGESALALMNFHFDDFLNDTLLLVYEIFGDINGSGPHQISDTLYFYPDGIWLIPSPEAGFILPGESKIIQLNFNSSGIPIGYYNRHFVINSNDITNPELIIPVYLVVFPYNLNQTIQIPQGWSGISAYVLPLNPAFETIFANVNDKIEAVYNNHSQLYWPDEGINTIGNWNTFDGYVIKAKEPTQILVYGIFESSQTVLLNAGWNIVPVLTYNPASTFVVFRDIDDLIDIVQEIGGSKVYWPSQGVYTLTQLMPGRAYMIRVKENCSFTYPSPVK